MATRSRRSAGGGGSPALNPTLIQFLDVARLRKELEIRGLPTTGARQILADRLSDAIDSKKPADEAKIEIMAVKRPRKKAVKVEPQEEPTAESSTVVKEEEDPPVASASKDLVVLSPHNDNSIRTPEKSKTVKAGKKRPVSSPRVVKSKRQRVIKPEVVSDDSDDDVPLLSRRPEEIAPVVVKTEHNATERPGPSSDSDDDVPLLSIAPDQMSSSKHKHGTRSKGLFQKDVVPTKRLEHDNRLLDMDDFVADPSPPMSPGFTRSPIPSLLGKGDSVWKPDAVKKKKERKMSNGRMERPAKLSNEKPKMIRPSMEKRPTVTEEWAKLMNERKKTNESNSASHSPQINTKKETEEKVAKVKPQPVQSRKATSSSSFADNDLLGSIISDQAVLLAEKMKKMEDAELERCRITEMKIATSQLERGRLPPQSTAFPLPPPRLIEPPRVRIAPPPPPPPKKMSPCQVAPPPPPPKHIQPLSRQQLSASSSPQPAAMRKYSPLILPPPPAPPKVLLPAKAKVVPPPPPPGPVPLHIQREREMFLASSANNSKSNSGRGSQCETPTSQPSTSSSAVNNNQQGGTEDYLVKSVTSALLKFLQNNKVEENKAREEVKACLESIICSVCESIIEDECLIDVDMEEDYTDVDVVNDEVKQPSVNIESYSKLVGGRQKQVEEEYDPFETSAITNFEEYIPSAVGTRNNTMIGTSDVESDDESIRDEEDFADDDMDSDEDEEEKESDTPPLPIQTVLPEAPPQHVEEKQSVPDIMKNPHEMLMRAKDVLESLNKPKISVSNESKDGPQYSQVPLGEEYEPEQPAKVTPEYHGEPVPSDDDDMLFEIAAGISKPKKKKEVVIEEEKLPSDETIEPDYYNADLHIKGANDKNWLIEPENADGLALMWGGVKSNYGIRLPFRDVCNDSSQEETEDSDKKEKQEDKVPSSNIIFQVKIREFLSTKHLPFEELDPHDIRVGFSLREVPNILGEHANSFCITSLGKKSDGHGFVDYGKPFHLNDIVTACFNFDDNSITFWINDEDMGVAFANVMLPNGTALFPHVAVKNCAVAVNFGDFPMGAEEWITKENWRFFSTLGRGDLERSPKAPESKANCTILMMVGLPGVGKTTWVRQYLRDHPNEQWTVIDSENVLAAMKVNGVSRRRAHHGRWDMVMGLIGKSLQRSVLLAARRRRNYIIDMSNTSREVRKKRLQLFEEFRRKCVVIIPSDEEMLDRQARQARHDGTAMMPPEAMLEMKAQLSIPAPDQEPLEEVYFIEPPIHRIQDAIDIVARYNEEARPWFQKKFRRRRAQNIGLGPDRDHSVPQRKFVQPLTVLAPLKVSIMNIEEHPPQVSSTSSTNLPSGNSTSLTVTTPVPTDTVTNFSVPPPVIESPITVKPMLGLKIEDIPSTSSYAPLPPKPPVFDPEDVVQLDEEEMRQLQESSKAKASNPMIAEAIMRAKLKKLQMIRKEKAALSSMTTTAPSVSETKVASESVQLIMTSQPIPSIGSKPLTSPIPVVSSSVSTGLRPLAVSMHDLSVPPPVFSPNIPPPIIPNAGLTSIAPPGLVQPNFFVPPPVITTPTVISSPQFPSPMGAPMTPTTTYWPTNGSS